MTIKEHWSKAPCKTQHLYERPCFLLLLTMYVCILWEWRWSLCVRPPQRERERETVWKRATECTWRRQQKSPPSGQGQAVQHSDKQWLTDTRGAYLTLRALNSLIREKNECFYTDSQENTDSVRSRNMAIIHKKDT